MSKTRLKNTVGKMSVHEQAHCQQGAMCTGPGCRVSTGKTSKDRQQGYQARRRSNQLERVGNPQSGPVKKQPGK